MLLKKASGITGYIRILYLRWLISSYKSLSRNLIRKFEVKWFMLCGHVQESNKFYKILKFFVEMAFLNFIRSKLFRNQRLFSKNRQFFCLGNQFSPVSGLFSTKSFFAKIGSFDENSKIQHNWSMGISKSNLT